MGKLYFDESIRSNGKFIIAALIYSEHDLEKNTKDHWKPFHLGEWTEYKSSDNHKNSFSRQCQRDTLNFIINANCKIGLVVCPEEERYLLGNHCCSLVKQLFDKNLIPEDSHQIYLDQNIKISREHISELEEIAIECNIEQDSKSHIGIQISDLAAHYAGTRLLEELGILNKIVTLTEECGYENGTTVELGFELWSEHRYAMFCSSESTDAEDDYCPNFQATGFGLYISNGCSIELSLAAQNCFGEIYLGCIHSKPNK